MNNSIRESQFRITSIVAVALAVMMLSACAETTRPEASGKGNVRGINAVATSPELLFMIEERSMGQVNFRGTAGFRDWDDLDYNFHFDILLPREIEPTRIASQYIDVVADTEHTVVLTGSLSNPAILTWESPERDWDGTETVFEADFAHLAPQLGQVDIYYAPDGVAPMPGTEIGTLSFGERVPHQEFDQDDYVLILTAPGDPSTVLFQSLPFTRSPAERVTVALFDTDLSITAPVGVNIIFSGGATQLLADVSSPAQVRVLHASYETPNFDGYLDENLSTLVFPNVAHGDASAFTDLTELVSPLTLTPVGDPGTTLFSNDIQLVLNTGRTLALFGEADALFILPLRQDARPLETYPVVRITHFSTNISEIDIYEVDPGTVLDETVPPKFGNAIIGISTQFFDAGSGMREFVLTMTGEKDPINVPVTLDLANGDIVDMAILDTADPAMVDLVIFDSNQ